MLPRFEQCRARRFELMGTVSRRFRHARPARPSHCGSQTPKREQEPGTVVALDQSTMGALGRYGGASAGTLSTTQFRPPSLVDTNTFGCRAPKFGR